MTAEPSVLCAARVIWVPPCRSSASSGTQLAPAYHLSEASLVLPARTDAAVFSPARTAIRITNQVSERSAFLTGVDRATGRLVFLS